MLTRLLATLCLLVFANTALAIDEIQYEVLRKTETYEVRLYPSLVVAEVNIHADFKNAGALGFRILADYLFGDNQRPSAQSADRSRIEMIVPMMMQKSVGGFTVGFSLPEKYALKDAPLPTDGRITLKQLPVRAVAVLRYSGLWSEKKFEENLEMLTTALKNDGVHTTGEPIFARYNSALRPPFVRRNEVWLEIVLPKPPAANIRRPIAKPLQSRRAP